MGRKIGNALIIYGILNWFVCLFLGPIGFIGGTIWLIIMIALGKWQRDKASNNERLARLEEERQPTTPVNVNLTNQIANQPQQDKIIYDDNLADAVNRILDEREGKNAIRYTKEDSR